MGKWGHNAPIKFVDYEVWTSLHRSVQLPTPDSRER